MLLEIHPFQFYKRVLLLLLFILFVSLFNLKYLIVVAEDPN